MAEIGFVGLGKLGLPVALAIESKGHNVVGYDVNPDVAQYIEDRWLPFKEKGIEPFLEKTNLEVVQSIGEVVARSDIVFVPVQTPHDPEYEGTTRLPEDRKDFDYVYIKEAIGAIAAEAEQQDKQTTLAVISTCLPGTFEREIRPLLNDKVDYVYTPQFIAMGTVIDDYLNPEFNLIGVESEEAADQLARFYTTINNAPNLRTDITTAEGIKVFYNTFITAKTLLANSWMQVAHETGMNVDKVTEAMSISTKRLLSPRYLRGGGPDSGGCHPRDLIALANLGGLLGVKPNLYELMAQAREEQTAWTADLVERYHQDTGLPIYVMGKAFKPETNIQTGSGALLVTNILKERGLEAVNYDPHVDDETPDFTKGVYLIATDHTEFSGWNYPEGSVILDLWRNVEPPESCLYVPIGNPNAIQDKRRKI